MKKFPPYFLPLGVIFTTLPIALADSGISPVEVPHLSPYVDATARGAIQLACSRDIGRLEDFFFSQGLPFRQNLVRTIRGSRCHVYFHPTLPGFRAAAEDDPVKGLSFAVDPLHLLIPADHTAGNSFGVIRNILRHLSRPLQIEFNTPFQHDGGFYNRKNEEYFGASIHRTSLRDRGRPGAILRWMQDLLKPGYCRGKARVLVPYRLFEGKPESGDLFDSIIRDFARTASFVRSKLAWDGGDLLFTRDPRQPERLVLYYGGVAKSYWGAALTPEEYEYILCLEFGADLAVDLSGLAPHVDYFVAFLARERIALVSERSVGSPVLARAALHSLLNRFRGSPPPELLELSELLEQDPIVPADIDALVRRIRECSVQWHFGINHGLWKRIESFVESACPGRNDCFSLENQAEMMREESDLLGRWVNEAEIMGLEPVLIQIYIDLIEDLLRRVSEPQLQRRREKILELEQLGFRIVSVPQFGGSPDADQAWPGISYVNCLIMEDQIFVPAFGLGAFEERIFSQLRDELPARYSLVPVPAVDVIARNGGLHCLAAITRGPSNGGY